MNQSNELSGALRQVLAGDHDSFGTFAVIGAEDCWVQYKPGEINAAYPFTDDPVQHLASFPDFEVLGWEANNYVFGDLGRHDPGAIADWIDRYFRETLQCPPSYELSIELEL